jgi:hypothetical protein
MYYAAPVESMTKSCGLPPPLQFTERPVPGTPRPVQLGSVTVAGGTHTISAFMAA